MQTARSGLLRVLFLVPIMLTMCLGIAACGSTGSSPTGTNPLTVLSVAGGNVQVQKSGSSSWSGAKEGITLGKGDKIKTDAGSNAAITFFDGSIIQLNGNTEISLDELIAKSASSAKTIKIGQKIGETTSTIVKMVDPASRYDVTTPSGVAAVRGSKMLVSVVGDGSTTVYNVEGTITFTAQGKEVSIPAGSGSSAKPGQPPSAPQPGLPAVIDFSNVTSVSSKLGWQQTGLYLNAGDKYYVEYRGGSWTVDYKNFAYVGSMGYTAEDDKKVAAGYKYDSTVPYCCLLGKVGSGKEIPVGTQVGPFTADAAGYLSLRINDLDASLVDNDGAITVALRGPDGKTGAAAGNAPSTSSPWVGIWVGSITSTMGYYSGPLTGTITVTGGNGLNYSYTTPSGLTGSYALTLTSATTAVALNGVVVLTLNGNSITSAEADSGQTWKATRQ